MSSVDALGSFHSVTNRQYREAEHALFLEYTDLKTPLNRSQACQVMQYYLQQLNLDISRRKYVHVTGSKGKGSTCSYVEAALRKHGLKTGLYTSPHIQSMCERFRINGKPISKETYLKHHQKVWTKLQEIKNRSKEERPPYITRWPGFFHFLTLVGFSLFLEEDVDVVVLEVGMGGRLDCTNVIENPLTTGITLIDLEHTAVLGSTLQAIAREKGGIFKKGAPAVVMNQKSEVIETLRECAKEADCSLQVVDAQSLPPEYLHELPASLPSYLLDDFAVANQLVKNALASFGITQNVAVMREVLHTTHVAARGQIVVSATASHHTVKWMIDGAHTPRSIAEVVKWVDASGEDNLKLLFYCGRDKNAASLLSQLVKLPLKEVILVMVKNPKPEYTKVELPSIDEVLEKAHLKREECGLEYNEEEWLGYLACLWRIEERMIQKERTPIRIMRDVDEAVPALNEDGTVCCTGSLYLCGDLLDALGYHEG